MAGSVNGPKRPPFAKGRDLVIEHSRVGLEREVQRFLHLRLAGSFSSGRSRFLVLVRFVGCVVLHPVRVDRMWAECHRGGAAVVAQPGGQRGVIGMAVGDEDGPHALAFQRRCKRLAM